MEKQEEKKKKKEEEEEEEEERGRKKRHRISKTGRATVKNRREEKRSMCLSPEGFPVLGVF